MEENAGRSNGRAVLKDVAARAGVTPMTASRVLNGKGSVRAETRRRVLTAAEDLAYRPNLAARALRTKRHNTVVFHSPELDMPLHLEVVLGSRQALRRGGYRLMLDAQSPADAAMGAATFDGSLVMPLFGRPMQDRREVAEACVCIMRRPTGYEAADWVGWDEYEVAARALRHLYDQGYRRVTWLGYGTAEEKEQRLDIGPTGFEFSPDSLSVQSIGNDPSEVDAVVGHIVDGPNRAQALLIISVIGTRLVMSSLRRRGLRAGRDLGLVGTEVRSQDWGHLLTPGMTAIVPPGFDMGITAARQLILRMDGDRSPPRNITLPSEFVIRGSTPGPRQPPSASQRVTTEGGDLDSGEQAN